MQRQEDKVPLHGELDDDQWREIGEVVMDALGCTAHLLAGWLLRRKGLSHLQSR